MQRTGTGTGGVTSHAMVGECILIWHTYMDLYGVQSRLHIQYCRFYILLFLQHEPFEGPHNFHLVVKKPHEQQQQQQLSPPGPSSTASSSTATLTPPAAAAPVPAPSTAPAETPTMPEVSAAASATASMPEVSTPVVQARNISGLYIPAQWGSSSSPVVSVEMYIYIL